MIRTSLIALGLLALFVARTSAAAERAIWTWEQASYAMLEDRAAADAAIAFLRSKHIGTVYLYADAYQERNLPEARPNLYRQLIRRLHARRLHTFALLGSAHLHTEAYVLPEHRNTGTRRWPCSGACL